MNNVIPFDAEARRLRKIMTHPNIKSVSLHVLPPAPAGYFQALAKSVDVGLFASLTKSNKVFVMPRDGTPGGYIEL